MGEWRLPLAFATEERAWEKWVLRLSSEFWMIPMRFRGHGPSAKRQAMNLKHTDVSHAELHALCSLLV